MFLLEYLDDLSDILPLFNELEFCFRGVKFLFIIKGIYCGNDKLNVWTHESIECIFIDYWKLNKNNKRK